METRLSSKPQSLQQFDGLNTATISLVMSPGVSMQAALDYLDQAKTELLPEGYSIDYTGKARSFLH